jgi:hypothetical protein
MTFGFERHSTDDQRVDAKVRQAGRSWGVTGCSPNVAILALTATTMVATLP